MRGRFAAVVVLAACGGGGTPDIIGLTDQVAVVGVELVVEIEGVDPDGDRLSYSVEADLPLEGVASMSQTPDGNGVFRWTPLATDVGMHAFDFTASDGDNAETVSITIDVRATAGGIPVFRQPLGTGRVYDLGADPCVAVDIVIEDEDSAMVTLGEEEPLITGATLMQSAGLMGQWRWCPTTAQVNDTNRYTLTLSADDGSNPRTLKQYVIVLGGGTVASTLVINEVDYDNISTDTAEFIEIYNASGTILPLAGLKVSLVNGATGVPYQNIDLGTSGQLAIGQYLIIAGPNVTVPTSAKHVDPLWTSDKIQNGEPDGIAIIDDVTHTVVDALSYEGDVTNAMLPGFAAPTTLVEGSALPATTADSNTATLALCRLPSGEDTNNSATDWTTCTTLSVGKKNM